MTYGLRARKMKIIECEVCHKAYTAEEFFTYICQKPEDSHR